MMKITELNGKLIKINDKSVSILDEATGKTIDIVRGVYRFVDMSQEDRRKYLEQIRQTGIIGTNLEPNLVVDDDGEVFLLYGDTTYDRRIESYPLTWPIEVRKSYEKRKRLLKLIESFGIEIVRCYMDADDMIKPWRLDEA